MEVQPEATNIMSSNSPEAPKPDEDDVISKIIGIFGRWQLQLTFFLSLFNFPCTWHIYAMTFQAPEVNFWCSPPDSLTILPIDIWRNISHTPALSHNPKDRDNPCSIWDVDYESFSVEDLINADFQHQNVGVRACDKWSFQEDFKRETVVSEWSLVCDRSPLKDTAEMTFLAGVALGGLVSGIVSDRFGRKKTLMSSLVMQITIGVILAFVPWFELFLVLRFVLGFVSVSVVFSGFVLCMELVGGKWRTISGVSYLFPVPLSYIAFAGIAYFVHGWKEIQLAITLPAILLLGLWWVLPESPRWLLATGKTEENIKVLQEAARVNKVVLPQNLDKLLQQGCSIKTDEGNNVGVLDLFRYPNIRKKSLVLYIIWFSVYFVYYGLVMNLSNIGGDIYVNTVISGVVEVPAIAISIVILLKMGRRWPLCLTLVGSGLACFLTLPFGDPELEWVTITLAMFGKFAIASSNAIIPVYTAELFPTVVRNLGVGSSNVSAGFSLVLVPYLWHLAKIDVRLPMGLLGVCGIVGGLSVLLLDETANQPMIDTLEEGEQLARSKKENKCKEQPQQRELDGNFNKSFSE